MVRMSEIQIEQVDERDSSWEHHHPRFRVYLHGSEEFSTGGWTDTYDVVGADIVQTIDWAQRQAGDSLTYAIGLVWGDDDDARQRGGYGRGLVWLLGMDGNESPDGERDRDTQHRMLVRRRAPVELPTVDLMPPGTLDPDNDGTRFR